jgi:acyl-coenzyme A thioesterase PaaI-like protein
MMALADFAMYVAVLGAVGPAPLAVTTNLNINFLRKPRQTSLAAEARLLKLGTRLATGEVSIRCLGDDALVAHVTATYSIPPSRGSI